MESRAAIDALAALAQESRLAVFRLLVEAGPSGMAAGEIASVLRIPAATLSFHLKELSRADLVVARPEGRFVYYSANFDRMAALVAFLTENCCIRDRIACAARGAAPSASPKRSSRSRAKGARP